MKNNKLKYLTLVAGLVLFSCSKMTHEDYVVQAESKMQKGEYSAAILAMKGAISEAPEDASSRVRLGQIYLGLDLYREAEKELSKAVALGASSGSIYEDLMKSLYLQNKHEDVVLLSAEIDEKIQEAKLGLKVYEALSLMEQGSYSQAINIRNALPSSNEKNFIKAYIHANQGRFQEAEESLLALPEDYHNEELLMLKAKLAFLRDDNEAAIRFFEEYLVARPNNFRAKIYLANTLVVEKNISRAEEVIQSAEQLIPEHPLLHQLKAEVSILSEDFSEAKLHAENAIAKGLGSDKVQVSLAIASFKTGAYEIAYEALSKIPKLVAANKGLEKLDLLLKVELGYPIALNETRIKQFDASFSELVSFDLLKRGYFDEASALANSALEDYESRDSLEQSEQYKQATLQLAFGQRSQGMKNLERIIADDENSSLASLLLAMNYFSRGDYSQAIAESEKGIAKDKDYVPLYSVALQAYLRLEDSMQAAVLGSQLRELAPGHETIALYDVSQELKRDNFDAAKAVLDDFLLKYEATDKLKTLLFSLNEKTNNQKDNLAFFSTVNTADDLLSKRLLILSLVNLSDIEKALALLKSYSGERKDSFYYDVMAKIHLAENDLPKAARVLSDWSQSAAQNETSYIKLINVLDVMGDETEAFKEAAKATKLFPKSEALALLYSHFAYRLNDTVSLKKGISMIRQLNANNETLPKLEGILLVMQGSVVEGIAVLEDMYTAQPTHKGLSEIISLLNEHGGTSASLRYLDNAVLRFPLDMNILQYYADAYLPRDASKAIPAYRTVLDKQPENISALNNLAWLLNKTGDTEEAMQLIVRAYELSEDNVSVASTYAGVLLSNKEFSKAAELLEVLINSKKAVSVTSVLNYAEALIQIDRKGEAQRVLRNISVEGDKLKTRRKVLIENSQ